MATYNRSHLLEQQLSAFKNQTLPASEFEVIIVNDGSTDHTREVLDNWPHDDVQLTVVHKQNGGPAAARNLGVEHARSAIIAFTDDDCIVDNDWLECIVNAFEQDSSLQVLHGSTYSNKAEIHPFTHQIECSTWCHVVPTCNAAYKTATFRSLGGFDTHFPFPHNEDTDLAWKAHEITEVKHDPNVRVYHPAINVSFRSQLKRMKFLRSEFLLFRKQKNAYQKWRTPNPWVTIYVEVFLKHQWLTMKSNLSYLLRPMLCMRSVALTVSCWIYLLILLPEYLAEHKKWRQV